MTGGKWWVMGEIEKNCTTMHNILQLKKQKEVEASQKDGNWD